MRRPPRKPRLRALRRPWVKLHRADCMAVLASLPSQSIDLVAVDPPYGVTDNPWDSAPPLAAWWEQIERVIRPAAVVAVFCQQPFTTDLITSHRKAWRYELVWHKPRPTGFLWARRIPLRAHEHVQIFTRRLCQSTYNPQMTQGKPYRNRSSPSRLSTNWGEFVPIASSSDGRRYPRSVLSFANVCGGKHPTQKPLELMEWIVKTYSNAGDCVLDCYMGSGTTGVACVMHGRSFVGVERSPVYFRTAEARIQEAKVARYSRAMRDCSKSG
jgi:site-specific DNA-methyltransferase (adenine-specific)